MQYQFTADGDRLHFLSVNEGSTGNVNAYECAVEFKSQDWAGLEKFAAFKVGADVYTRLLTNGRCLIPSQALERAQAIYIGVYGIDPAAQTDKKLSTNWTVMNISEGACQPGVTTPAEPEPDVWEEYIGEIVNIRDNMTPYVGENGNWFVWDKTSQAMADSGRPARGAAGFTPQKGVDYFTEADIESLGLAGKADKAETLAGYGIGDAYTKAEVDSQFTDINNDLTFYATLSDLETYSVMKEPGKGLSANDYTDADKAKLAGKADKAETLAGYGIGDAYTKAQTEAAIREKLSNVYDFCGSVKQENELTVTDALKKGSVFNWAGADTSYTYDVQADDLEREVYSDTENGSREYIKLHFSNAGIYARPGGKVTLTGEEDGELYSWEEPIKGVGNDFILIDYDQIAYTEICIENVQLKLTAGDNIVWLGNCWDKLAGTVDLSGYVQKESGKGLSANDYTDADKAKLEGIEAGAQVNTVTSVNGETGAAKVDINSVMEQGNVLGTVDFTCEFTENSIGLYGPYEDDSRIKINVGDSNGCVDIKPGLISMNNMGDVVFQADTTGKTRSGTFYIAENEENYLHIVGNGLYGQPSNAHTLDWDGNAWFAGKVEPSDYTNFDAHFQDQFDTKANQQTTDGGFAGGSNPTATSGGAIGKNAKATSGGAIGSNSYASYGGAVGQGAWTTSGGAVGVNAKTLTGFAGGNNAKTIATTGTAIDAIQLGTGTNTNEKTLQVYDYPLMNADGTIPAERIPQLAGKADKEAVYAKPESDMRYLPKGTAAGYPLTVSDHLEGAGVINYRIQGNAEQETRSGKNLFNIDEITPKTGMTKNGTQIIFDAETYAHVFKDLSLYKTLLPNTTYTISTVYTGQGVEPTAAGAIRMAKPTGETFTLLGPDATAYTNEYRTTTFTTPADIAEYIWIYLYASRTTSITIYDKIQIELGESATDYEPYGAVPSPEFPGAVQTVGDLMTEGEQAGKYHVPVKICGKNWLDEAYFKERSNLTADASSYYGAQVKLLPDTQYTFSRKDNAGYNAKVNNRNVYAKIVAGGTSYLFMHTTSQANNKQTFTFTTGADGLVIFSFYPCFSQAECDGFWDLLGWCQIELGAAQTAYEPYTADTADIYAARPLIGVKNLGGKCINPDYVDAKTGQAVYRNTEFVVDGSCYGAASVKYAYLFPQTASGTDEKTGTALALAKVNPGYASAVYQSIPGVLGTKDDGTYYKSDEVGIASNMFHTMSIANRSKELYGVYAGSVGNYAGYILFTVPFDEVNNIDVGEYTSSDPDEIQGKKLALWFQQKYDAGTPVRFYYPHAGAAQTEQLTIPAITAPQSSAMTILAETATPPAEISAEYYQDVNKKLLEKDKKIEELQALILENIGG